MSFRPLPSWKVCGRFAVAVVLTIVTFSSRSESLAASLNLVDVLRDGNGLVVDVSDQRLYLLTNATVSASYPVSTSAYGTGSEKDSYRTPLGLHEIAARIGHGRPPGTVFVGGVETGEIAPIETAPRKTERDLVTSRILRLRGLEPGSNLGPGIDSWERLIYIHGTHEEGLIGSPASNGCIRMKNADVVALFEQVRKGTRVFIRE